MTDDELKALVASNARSIEAMSSEWRGTVEMMREGFKELRQGVAANREAIAELRAATQDNSVAVAELLKAQAETSQQIQVLIEESRDSRKWLRAAQENIQTLFHEIKRIWDRFNAA